MTKSLIALASVAVMLLSGILSQAEAAKYQFSCKTMYMVTVPVTVEGENEAAARKKFKTEKDLREFYDQCSYLREVKEFVPDKKIETTDEKIEF